LNETFGRFDVSLPRKCYLEMNDEWRKNEKD